MSSWSQQSLQIKTTLNDITITITKWDFFSSLANLQFCHRPHVIPNLYTFIFIYETQKKIVCNQILVPREMTEMTEKRTVLKMSFIF